MGLESKFPKKSDYLIDLIQFDFKENKYIENIDSKC